MRLRPLAAVVAAALVAAPAVARAQAPNLSGTWELDLTASSFGMMPAPQKATMTVVHAEPALKVTTVSVGARGERTESMSYTTDGKESKNAGMMGSEMVSVLRWEGAVLVMDTKTQVQGNDIAVAARWTLAPDGKTLTLESTAQTPMGALEQRRVFQKRG